jgi:hypothetical protein
MALHRLLYEGIPISSESSLKGICCDQGTTHSPSGQDKRLYISVNIIDIFGGIKGTA